MALYGNPLQDDPAAILAWLQQRQQGGAPAAPESRVSQIPGAPGFTELPAAPVLPQALAQLTGVPGEAGPPAAPRGRALPKTMGSVTTTAPTPPAAPAASAQAPAATPAAPTGAAPTTAPAGPQSALEQLPGIYAKSNALRDAAYDKLTPSEADLETYRRSGTTGQLAGMALQLLGNEAQQGLGGHVLKQSMAELEKGKRDPWKIAELEAKKLEAQATALEKQAQFAVTVEEKQAAERRANELKVQAMELRADMARQSLEMRGAIAGQMAAAREDRRADQDQRQTAVRTDTIRREYSTRLDKVRQGSIFADQVVGQLADPNITKSGPAQVALVMQFGKMLDPDSVVREAEQQMIASARGFADSLQQYIPALMTGARLSPDQIKKMRDVAIQYQAGSKQRVFDLNDIYTGIATRNRLPVADIGIMGGTSPAPGPGQPPPAAAPAPGVPGNPGAGYGWRQ